MKKKTAAHASATASPSASPDGAGWPDPVGWPGETDWPGTTGWAKAIMASPESASSSTAMRPILQKGGKEITGDDILALAAKHVGEKYVFGARAPMSEAGWKGPWDCAEFVSWCVYQTAGVLFGTQPRHDPIHADAFTGYWAQQARQADATIPLADALVTTGAILLRYPMTGAIGHIAFSDGQGGTIEAHSTKKGVIKGKAGGRRWDVGVLIPGIRYFQSGETISPEPPGRVFRLTQPLTKSAAVAQIQTRLGELGFASGPADGIYGPQTAHAVSHFQGAKGLVVDGESGPATLKALGLL